MELRLFSITSESIPFRPSTFSLKRSSLDHFTNVWSDRCSLIAVEARTSRHEMESKLFFVSSMIHRCTVMERRKTLTGRMNSISEKKRHRQVSKRGIRRCWSFLVQTIGQLREETTCCFFDFDFDFAQFVEHSKNRRQSNRSKSFFRDDHWWISPRSLFDRRVGQTSLFPISFVEHWPFSCKHWMR